MNIECEKCGTTNTNTAKFCKKCGNNLTKSRMGAELLQRKEELRLEEEAVKKEEAKMAEAGYFKGEMCPFTQVKVGGTENIGSAVLWGTPTSNVYTWQHCGCIGKYCKMWDAKKEDCVLKLAALHFIK